MPVDGSNRPVQVPITGASRVMTGGLNTFVLKGDKTVWGWGRPDGGRLGDGGSGDGRTPVQVRNVSNVTALVVGDVVSMALDGSNVLWGWGENAQGQLGTGHRNAVVAPVSLTVPTTGSIQKAAAGDSSFIVDSLGRLFGAGSNAYGALGLGDTLETRAPKAVAGIGGVQAVAAGATESLALRARRDGVDMGRTRPERPERCDGDPAASRRPDRHVREHLGRAGERGGDSQRRAAVRLGKLGSRDWRDCDAGPRCRLRQHGERRARKGRHHRTHQGRTTIVACATGCERVDFGFADVTAVAAGSDHFLARRADGSVWAFGANDVGQLGTGTTAAAAAPVRVAGLPPVATIAAGAHFSVAVASDGAAFAWGLPPPFDSPHLVPVRVAELDGSALLAVSAHVLSLDAARRGVAWGGTSKAGERDHVVPGREPRMDDLRAIAAGPSHSLGVTATGDVVAWGQNAFQQLGVVRKQAASEWLPVMTRAVRR